MDANSIDLDVERNVLTVRADRPMREGASELVAAERPRGVFSRQLILGDNLDLDKITAAYRDGVLQLMIPVAERAKPRKISIDTDGDHQTIEGTERTTGCLRLISANPGRQCSGLPTRYHAGRSRLHNEHRASTAAQKQEWSGDP